MTFGEELLLLLLDERRGNLTTLPEWLLNYALAGSALVDLASANRIDTDPQQLFVVDATPLEDDILDPVLEEIVRSKTVRDASYWVKRIAALHGSEIREKSIQRLVTARILRKDEGGFWSLVPAVRRSRRYTHVDGEKREEIRLRIMRVLFDGDIPDPDEVVMIGLADACGVFARILTPSEMAMVRDRIALVRRMDLIGRAVTDAIRAEKPPRELRDYREIPTVPRPDYWALVKGRYIDYLKEQYARVGPIFQTSLSPIFKTSHRERHAIVMVGPEANRFFNKYDKTHFRSGEFWSTNDHNFGASRSVFSMVGEEHFRMRRLKAPGYSRGVGESQVTDIIRIVRDEIATWPIDRPIHGTKVFKKIVYNLSCEVLVGISAPEYYEDLTNFLDASLKVTVGRYSPRKMRRRSLRRARVRLDELANRILALHDPDNKEGSGRPPDIVDAMLALNRSDPQFMPETDLKLAVLEPLWVPVDTTGHVSGFMMYALLKNADLRERVTAEADALFAESSTSPSFRSILGLDVTNRTFLETARLYPPLDGIFRTVSNSFEFEGCRVPAGATVLVPMSFPHAVAEHYPNPERFDIERFKPPRNEHLPSGVYAPFGVGTHRCLGGHLAEFLIAATMATIFHHVDVELCPPRYTVTPRQISYVPTIHLKKSFRFRVVRKRNDW